MIRKQVEALEQAAAQGYSIDAENNVVMNAAPASPLAIEPCNDPTIGSYNHYHLSPNGIPTGNQRWYGLVYFIQIAGKPRIRPRQLLGSLEVLY